MLAMRMLMRSLLFNKKLIQHHNSNSTRIENHPEPIYLRRKTTKKATVVLLYAGSMSDKGYFTALP